jgi:choline-glycine betaine transporter
MAESWVRQMNKTTGNRISFYVNIFLFLVIVLATIFLILDTYKAGIIVGSSTSGGNEVSQAWLSVVRDIAVLAVALALIFFQFFRNLRTIILRSW